MTKIGFKKTQNYKQSNKIHPKRLKAKNFDK
jgi:hypothetical protein